MDRFTRLGERLAAPLLGCTVTFVVLLVLFCGVVYFYGFGVFFNYRDPCDVLPLICR